MKKLKIFLIVISVSLFVMPGFLFGQVSSVGGLVYDNELFQQGIEKTLPGATVVIVGTGLSDLTDNNGRYRIDNVPCGDDTRYTMEVSCPGYQSYPPTCCFVITCGKLHTANFFLKKLTTPTVTTTSASNITINSAQSGGNVSNDGGATVTARGVCWSTSQNPTISDNHTTDGSGTGSFTSSITGLSPGITYLCKGLCY